MPWNSLSNATKFANFRARMRKGFEIGSRRGEKEKSQRVLQVFLRIEGCFAKGLIPKRSCPQEELSEVNFARRNVDPQDQGVPNAPEVQPQDPGTSLSFVTPYVAMNFHILPEKLFEPFNVSTPVGESILAEKLYRGCTISVNHKDTVVDLIKLDMVDIDVILEWRSSLAVPKDNFISYLKAKKLVSKGCIYHLV
uniref:Polyprotein n=1 Tax=Solanum tuberosum TaxID=4113 RepID=M1DJI7_SOLTU